MFTLLKLNDDEILVGGSFKTASGSMAQNLAVYERGSNSLRPLTASAYTAGSQTSTIAVDEAVYRQLLPMFAVGIFDRKYNNSAQYMNATSVAHNTLARELSENGTVL